MEYYVYTDASVNEKEKKAACAYMVLSDGKFITAECEEFRLSSSRDAEAKAVAIAAISLCRFVKPGDIVRYYIDNVDVFKVVRAYSRGRKFEEIPETYNHRVRSLCSLVSRIVEICKVEPIKVQAHVGRQCGNTTVDRLARYTLRLSLLEGEECGECTQ